MHIRIPCMHDIHTNQHQRTLIISIHSSYIKTIIAYTYIHKKGAPAPPPDLSPRDPDRILYVRAHIVSEAVKTAVAKTKPNRTTTKSQPKTQKPTPIPRHAHIGTTTRRRRRKQNNKNKTRASKKKKTRLARLHISTITRIRTQVLLVKPFPPTPPSLSHPSTFPLPSTPSTSNEHHRGNDALCSKNNCRAGRGGREGIPG